MELPKNVTQIGESDRTCKVYVEDYVVSYLKQLNQVARNKDIAVALYGTRSEEEDVSYLFLYGAAKLNFLQREVRHLSQAQMQEIEQNRQRFFSQYEFQGYRILNGEMIEGFHICERGICRYIAGYAQFYEKNDSMLNFMLEARSGEVQPEFVDQEKYENEKRRREARRAQAEERGKASAHKAEPPKEPADLKAGLSPAERDDLSRTWEKEPPRRTSLQRMKVAAVAVFALLALVGLTSANGGLDLKEIQVMARQTLNGLTEQKLPDETEAAAVMGPAANSDTLVAEDKLTEAIRQENGQETPATGETAETEENLSAAAEGQNGGETVPTEPSEAETQQAEAPQPETVQPEAPVEESASAQGQAMTSYVIEKGDTLTDICVRNYGSDARVQEICVINSIADPDDIKVGQKILLPQ